MKLARLLIFMCCAALGLASAAQAQLRIEIIGGGAKQIPVAIVPLRGEDKLAQSITGVVAADLQRSGLFKMVDAGGLATIPAEPAEVNYGTWQGRGAEAIAIGSVTAQGGGRYDVRFRLLDVLKQTQLTGFAYNVTEAQLRATAHKIADAIYEKLTGEPGVFSTRIAYIVKSGTRYELQVADADGHAPQTVLASNEPIISPAWSPDGTRLAYVSFERKKPIVYVQSLASSQRQVVANFKGSNSAPAWSPDGRRLAVVLTKDGSSQIYLINADGSGAPARLVTSPGIDTEPAFTPDGQWVLFTSDRGGSPQIYRVRTDGGQPERITFEGSYNVAPHVAPDGKSFAFVQRNGGRFQIAVQDLASRQVQVLTDGGMDESPSFAPNGKMIVFASDVRGRGILGSVSSDGRVRQRITLDAGDVREPAWGPIVKQ